MSVIKYALQHMVMGKQTTYLRLEARLSKLKPPHAIGNVKEKLKSHLFTIKTILGLAIDMCCRTQTFFSISNLIKANIQLKQISAKREQ